MTQNQYSLICEDKAHLVFIKALMPRLLNYLNIPVPYTFNSEFYFRFQAISKYQVVDKMKNATIIAFRNTEYKHIKFLLIGLDFDDKNRTQFNNEIKELYNKLHVKVRNKSIIFFPVQVIEHWMLFVDFKVKHPGSTKNIAATIEKKDRKIAKKEIYGKLKPKSSDVENIIKKSVEDLDIDWLISQSESFRRFINDSKNVIS